MVSLPAIGSFTTDCCTDEMNARPFATASDRNKQAILTVIRDEFRGRDSILEIGSGTGQHAVHFAAELPDLVWQTSDVLENHDGIRAWIQSAALANVRAPIELDVTDAVLPPRSYDGVFSANTAHIMSSAAVESMFSLVGKILRDTGVFVLYGPFRQHNNFNTESNAEFHRTLQQREGNMGIRHLEDLDEMASTGRLRRLRVYAMPANNHTVVWTKDLRGLG